MGLWAKSVVIFNAIRKYGKQSVRSLADRTGLSKSSVHRHLQAMDRRDRSPESSLWETEAGRAWRRSLCGGTGVGGSYTSQVQATEHQSGVSTGP